MKKKALAKTTKEQAIEYKGNINWKRGVITISETFPPPTLLNDGNIDWKRGVITITAVNIENTKEELIALVEERMEKYEKELVRDLNAFLKEVLEK